MFTDIVVPQNNEQAFVQMAEKLGFRNLILVSANRATSKKIRVFSGDKTGSDITVVKASEFSRESIEHGSNLIYDLESHGKRDYMHQRNSGLNQVLCRLAAKKKVIIGFSMRTLINSDGMLRGQLAGRMSQNISLCRKFKNDMVTASFAEKPYEMRSPSDLQALAITLGMHPKEAKDSLTKAYKKILENQNRKSPKYLAEGAELV